MFCMVFIQNNLYSFYNGEKIFCTKIDTYLNLHFFSIFTLFSI